MPVTPRPAPPRAAFVASIFLSASLLFFVQPMVGKVMLPRYGGSPAVWNTAMVFFQLLLLAGYAYAHAASKWPARRQAAIHAVVLVGSLLALPPTLRAGLQAPPSAWPVPWVLAALAFMVGLPFFALSSNSSLVQHWYARGGSQGSRDPYWLYAASNAGSFLALFLYPFLVERLWGLSAQKWIWSGGYLAFVALSLVGLWRVVMRSPSDIEPDFQTSQAIAAPDAKPLAGAPTWRRRLGWAGRAGIATSLLLSVTMRFTTDVAAIPLFWVVPLALYLLSFILAFSPRLPQPRSLLAGATQITCAGLLAWTLVPVPLPLWLLAGLMMVALLAGTWLCHGDLAADRPDAAHLTDFYLWLAAGGAIGGVLNSLLAPVVFHSVAEFPLTLAAVCWLAACPPGSGLGLLSVWRGRGQGRGRDQGRFQIAAILGIISAMVVAAGLRLAGTPGAEPLLLANAVLAASLLLVLFRQPRPAAVATALVALFVVAGLNAVDPVVDEARSFFGVVRVVDEGGWRLMFHGTTNHGAQLKDPAMRRTPIAYHHPDGPLGSVVNQQPPGATIGVLGLGAGALAALGKPGQTMIFYEIDPLVETMARSHFTYLSESPAHPSVVIGDGRLTLEAAPDASFDLLVMDAFSSDSIPLHLLTQEALALYLQKTKPGGIVLFNATNRYARLIPLFEGLTDHGRALSGAAWAFTPSPELTRLRVSSTLGVAVAREGAPIDALVARGGWERLGADPGARAVLWTDDVSNLLDVLDWTWAR